MLISNNRLSKSLFAVSFDTVTYRDLEYFIAENNPLNYKLLKIDPYEFLKSADHSIGSYINLVTRDMQLRQLVTEKLDIENLDRFSVVHEKSFTSAANIGSGCMVYPMVSMYTNATLIKDNIIHSSVMIAHDSFLDVGSYVSAGVNIAGTTKVGKFCQFGLASIVADNINIVDHVTVGMGTVVRKSITQSGVYVTQTLSDITKIK